MEWESTPRNGYSRYPDSSTCPARPKQSFRRGAERSPGGCHRWLPAWKAPGMPFVTRKKQIAVGQRWAPFLPLTWHLCEVLGRSISSWRVPLSAAMLVGGRVPKRNEPWQLETWTKNLASLGGLLLAHTQMESFWGMKPANGMV